MLTNKQTDHYIEIGRGPKMLPCGTPEVTSRMEDLFPLVDAC